MPSDSDDPEEDDAGLLGNELQQLGGQSGDDIDFLKLAESVTGIGESNPAAGPEVSTAHSSAIAGLLKAVEAIEQGEGRPVAPQAEDAHRDAQRTQVDTLVVLFGIMLFRVDLGETLLNQPGGFADTAFLLTSGFALVFGWPLGRWLVSRVNRAAPSLRMVVRRRLARSVNARVFDAERAALTEKIAKAEADKDAAKAEATRAERKLLDARSAQENSLAEEFDKRGNRYRTANAPLSSPSQWHH